VRRLLSPILSCIVAISAAALCAALPAGASPASERAASVYLDAVRDDPPRLRAFMQRLPKGGDLHNHASGAVYAERYIDWAVADKLCVDETFTLMTCDRGGKDVAAQLQRSGYRDRLIDALSMRAFVPREESGHDHFFTSFDKFGAAGALHKTEVVAEAVRQAAQDRADYLELMYTFGGARPGPSVFDVTKGIAFDGDFDTLRAALEAKGFANVVAAAQRELQALESDRAAQMRCGAPVPAREPGCAVQVRYIQQVIRALDPVTVFAQTMLGFELAKRDERLAGVNFVSPEDGPVAVRDYGLHMRMIAYLRRTAGDVPVSLHAGELTLGLVPRDVLDDHIELAVNVAGARRIGHGVDIAYERRSDELLRTMAARRVLVEIALTSNDAILGVRGSAHPLPLYLRSGVPVALVTDDEGVSRIDFSNEFVRAARDYRLSYTQLKGFIRNSLTYAFVRGDAKTRLRRTLERKLDTFEAQYLHPTPR
jgi:hypothetical protein